MRKLVGLGALALVTALTTGVQAQSNPPVKLINVAELSGAGSSAGTMWTNGAALAVAEVNAKGGILGRQIQFTTLDTQTNPGTARAQVQKAIDDDTYVVLGPVFSGSIKVAMAVAQQNEVAQIMGGEAADLTQAGNPYLFRTSFGQQSSMPKLANYLRDEVKAKKVAVVWINNDFGKGGRDSILKELKARGIAVAADVSTEGGQVDYAADVVKVKASGPDAVFVYLNEDESARFLREARKQGITVPLVGETTLLGQKVIDLAGEAANGVRGHVGLSADAPIPAVEEFKKRFMAKYNAAPDHNGIKGYTAIYAIKAVTEKMGKFDRKGFAAALHGFTITPAKEPGILMEATWDKNGDIDRISFLAEVVGGKQKIVKTLPKLGN